MSPRKPPASPNRACRGSGGLSHKNPNGCPGRCGKPVQQQNGPTGKVSGRVTCIIENVAPLFPTRKASPYSKKLIESYCSACGLLIAASPRRQVLAIMEKLHRCPVYFRYPQKIRRAS